MVGEVYIESKSMGAVLEAEGELSTETHRREEVPECTLWGEGELREDATYTELLGAA